ncbi:uncharacterized protein LOC122043865 [Zingiber officinale]|uniref:Uncharacterized protein n=1 Tax=Zingiber officinale TaxID=94328 RepID=A0A8J5HPL4_ZINOF|nr:uncharacterized protein LOC122043865 [Zingiber officinale]KAG6528645.1 hypothetical protein ZIOFF_010829 [Zingiber officinale]
MTATAMVTDVARSPVFPAFFHLSLENSLEPSRERADEKDTSGGDFEFRLRDPVAMLHADELFVDGKLVPLNLAPAARGVAECAGEIHSSEQPKARWRTEDLGSDQYLFSPRAPSCAIRWRELLRLKRAAGSKLGHENASAAASSIGSRKHFFHRNPKSSSVLDPVMSLPLLRESDSESVSVSSSRLSLSSSSAAGRDHEGLPRLSLDAEKPRHHMAMLRLVRPLPATAEPPFRGRIRRAGSSDTAVAPATTGTGITLPVDSPRMNPSGKVVFHGLERSSSTPGSFTGGPRLRLQGMQRSYSSNVVRVTPVLNVPVCSLAKTGPVFGFAGQLFSPQKKDKANAAAKPTSGVGKRNKSRKPSGLEIFE